MGKEKKKGLLEILFGWLIDFDQVDSTVEPPEQIDQVTAPELTMERLESPMQKAEPAKPAVPVYKEKVYKVTGMSHYMDGIMELAEENDNYDLKKKELIEYGLVDERVWKYNFSPAKAELVPEPDNPEDPRAIKVLVDGIHVGYIKAGSCAHLLKVIREGRIVKIECKMYGGPYKYVAEEWDDEKDKFVYEFEKSEVSYGVTLTITEK